MQKYTHIVHGFEPIFDKQSKILILGSLPSVKSREQGFYYGHPRNRFWKVLAAVTDMPVPNTVSEKREFLTAVHIAVWDVIQQCDIIGSSDASIKNVTPTDLENILGQCGISAIFANGNTAAGLYKKYQEPITARKIITLPSTSPANAAWSLERLTDKWGCIKEYL